ncbi:MAG: tRNA pseudouridine(38-40) synthase TruA [Actinomycetia bacterium]|nr:tRNA pseudouridine(38-40) synthase TruA [Actinomycetes bacterium]
MTVRWRLDVAYDGAAFSGWAAQPGLRTVQGELETWVGRVLRLPDPVSVTCAGRTDAGVHARGQVVHTDLPEQVSAGRSGPEDTGRLLARRLARALPDDLVVRRVQRAPAGFDARFAALWRRYVYRLWDRPEAVDPLRRGHVCQVRSPLDLQLMTAAAEPLLGLHDFAAFCRARDGATTIRELQQLRLARGDDQTVEVTVRADAFCHSMVRSLVGALTMVGSGQRPVGWLAGLVDAGGRCGEVRVMPAHGLTLEEVGYPPDHLLAARAAEARATRKLR